MSVVESSRSGQKEIHAWKWALAGVFLGSIPFIRRLAATGANGSGEFPFSTWLSAMLASAIWFWSIARCIYYYRQRLLRRLWLWVAPFLIVAIAVAFARVPIADAARPLAAVLLLTPPFVAASGWLVALIGRAEWQRLAELLGPILASIVGIGFVASALHTSNDRAAILEATAKWEEQDRIENAGFQRSVEEEYERLDIGSLMSPESMITATGLQANFAKLEAWERLLDKTSSGYESAMKARLDRFASLGLSADAKRRQTSKFQMEWSRNSRILQESQSIERQIIATCRDYLKFARFRLGELRVVELNGEKQLVGTASSDDEAIKHFESELTALWARLNASQQKISEINSSNGG